MQLWWLFKIIIHSNHCHPSQIIAIVKTFGKRWGKKISFWRTTLNAAVNESLCHNDYGHHRHPRHHYQRHQNMMSITNHFIKSSLTSFWDFFLAKNENFFLRFHTFHQITENIAFGMCRTWKKSWKFLFSKNPLWCV